MVLGVTSGLLRSHNARSECQTYAARQGPCNCSPRAVAVSVWFSRSACGDEMDHGLGWAPSGSHLETRICRCGGHGRPETAFHRQPGTSTVLAVQEAHFLMGFSITTQSAAPATPILKRRISPRLKTHTRHFFCTPENAYRGSRLKVRGQRTYRRSAAT